MIHRSFSARADIEEILSSLSAPRVDVPVLQPADPFLDTAGEDLRRRIFMTASETGEAFCLRPEFTIPVCRHHIAQNCGSARYGYVGTVFRQHREAGAEFLQAGIEDIGNSDFAQADAQSLADALSLLDALNLTAPTTILLGDQNIFDAVLDALDLPRAWRLRLSHAFGDEETLASTLDSLRSPPSLDGVPEDIARALDAGQAMLTGVIAAHMEKAGLLNAGGRTPDEIAARLLAKAETASRKPDAKSLSILADFLTVKTTLDKAPAALAAFFDTHGLAQPHALGAFTQRLDAMVGKD
ncbi:MAG: ATP phosphoribosyltransferase regulatory subunit, partial [Ahrensia sp.]